MDTSPVKIEQLNLIPDLEFSFITMLLQSNQHMCKYVEAGICFWEFENA